VPTQEKLTQVLGFAVAEVATPNEPAKRVEGSGEEEGLSRSPGDGYVGHFRDDHNAICPFASLEP